MECGAQAPPDRSAARAALNRGASRARARPRKSGARAPHSMAFHRGGGYDRQWHMKTATSRTLRKATQRRGGSLNRSSGASSPRTGSVRVHSARAPRRDPVVQTLVADAVRSVRLHRSARPTVGTAMRVSAALEGHAQPASPAAAFEKALAHACRLLRSGAVATPALVRAVPPPLAAVRFGRGGCYGASVPQPRQHHATAATPLATLALVAFQARAPGTRSPAMGRVGLRTRTH